MFKKQVIFIHEHNEKHNARFHGKILFHFSFYLQRTIYRKHSVTFNFYKVCVLFTEST